MLQALLALLALLAQALVPTAAPGELSANTAAEATQLAPDALLLDASLLPAPTGWFLVPIQVDRATDVRVDAWAEAEASPQAASAYQILVHFPGQQISPALGGDAFVGAETLGVHAAGLDAASCCPAETLALRESRDAREGRVEPGEVLWVGLVAAEWQNASRLEVRVKARDATLTAGETITGTGARIVDLVREAAGNGAHNVIVAGRLLTGNMTDARVGFAPNESAFLAVHYLAKGRAGANLEVQVAGGDLVPHPPLRDVEGDILSLAPGAVNLTLRNVQMPGATDNASELRAVALVADIPWPDAFLGGHHRTLAADEASTRDATTSPEILNRRASLTG